MRWPKNSNRKADPPSSLLGEFFKEIRHRASDFLGAFASSGVQTIARDLSSEKVLTHLAELIKKFSQVDMETVKALRFVVQSTVEMYKESFQRRQSGQYEVDEFGLDPEFLDHFLPLFAFLYKKWWRVTAHGIENVPVSGPALLVANHSGVLPWDGAMLAYAVYSQLPKPRITRTLYLDWFTKMPFIQPILARTGQVFACPENAERLLKKGHLTAVFPEGIKGVGKLFKNRYRLARFGRGGFVKVAIRTRVPIIPVSVVGAEEIYPTLLRADWLGKPIGSPFFPLTPLWPWFGLLGLIPLPSKWTIHFGKPIPTDTLAPRDANNFLAIQELTHRVRNEIQQTLQKALLRRKSVFV